MCSLPPRNGVKMNGGARRFAIGALVGLMSSCGAPGSSPAPPAPSHELPAPDLRSPALGYMSGSVHAPSDHPVRSPLRPIFRWERVPGAEHYELQLDDSCVPGRRSGCDFASPELVERVTDRTVFRPLSDLPVEMSPPVGRRYYWRVRACVSRRCSAWSSVRYLLVGRSVNDFDGDGYGDIARGATAWVPEEWRQQQGHPPGRIYVYRGGDSGPVTEPAVVLDSPAEGHRPDSGYFGSVLTPGDMDGDGFSDLVARGMGAGIGLVLYRGSASGLRRTPHVLGSAAVQWEAFSSGGDVDGDGWPDIVASGVVGGVARVLVFSGHPEMGPEAVAELSPPSSARRFGSQLSVGDLDGDGRAEVVVDTNPSADCSTPSQYHIYSISTDGSGGEEPAGTFPFPLRVSDGCHVRFREASIADLNGDGYLDFVTGAIRSRGERVHPFTFIYVGGSGLGSERPSRTVTDSVPAVYLGWSTGDFDGDGLHELLLARRVVGPMLWADMVVWDAVVAESQAGLELPSDGRVAGLGDVDGDGKDELFHETYRPDRWGEGDLESSDILILDVSRSGVREIGRLPGGGEYGESADFPQ